jgi:hypothetical protein
MKFTVLVVLLGVLATSACTSTKSVKRLNGDKWDSDGLFPVMYPNRKWGYIDPSGKVVIPAQFAVARFFSEGLAAVSMTEPIDAAGHYNKLLFG